MKVSLAPSEHERDLFMILRHFAKLPVVAASLAALAPPATAAEQACTAPTIETDARFREGFPDLLARIQNELASRGDIDACARVALHLEAHANIDVSVTLPDGRTASRQVARRDDVIPTLQALLLVPNAPPFAASEPVTAPAPTPSRPAAKLSSRRREGELRPGRTDRDVSPAPVARPRQLGFELSAISGVRIGDGQYGYGVGVLSFLQVQSWLLGFEGRADGYRSLIGSDPETALELAILAGRRLDFGSMALDLTAGPAIAMKGVTFSHTERAVVMGMPSPSPPPTSEPSSAPVARLLLGARLGFSPRSVLRTFVGIDGELGPSRSSAAVEGNTSSPRMPTYTVGLALGATVGTP
jgi:hypothetical protein